MSTLPNKDSSGPVIAHLFADHGVESEALAAYGTVVRVTRDPRPNPFVAETVALDLMETAPAGRVDLALLHPRCTDVADTTSISGDPSEYANQIPRAREIAESLAEDYIIENKPRDDLRDPTVLNGRMFGLPIEYERAFETTFPVSTPPRERALAEKTVTPYYYSDRTAEWWAATKGYSAPQTTKQHLAKNCLPRVYVDHLVRSWLEARNPQDGTVPQDNNGRAPRDLADDQTTLTELVARE